MIDRLYTLREVAAVLRVTPRTVRRIVAWGELGTIRVGCRFRVRESDLARYIAGRGGR